MTKNIEGQTPDHQAGLLACCRHLAMLTDQEACRGAFGGRKETFAPAMTISPECQGMTT